MRLLSLFAVLAFAFGWSEAVAQPQLPSTFYGSASIDGQPVPNGTLVRAYIDGVDCTQGTGASGTFAEGNSAAYVVHVIHESQKEGCGREGKTVTFRIGDATPSQTAPWRAGPRQLDLNAGSGQPVPLPTATPVTPTVPASTPAGTPTASPADLITRTPPATSGTDAPTGTTPTGDVRFGQTPKPPGDGDPGDSSDDDPGGFPIGLALLAAFVLLAAGGGAVGLLMSRRATSPENPNPDREEGGG